MPSPPPVQAATSPCEPAPRLLVSASAAHAAFAAHDPRFDGRLFIGVTSTGIYCRPVCRVRTPRPANCRFFPHAAAAEAQGFRPCLRCRPELAPGWAPIDMPSRLAWAAAQRIEAGALDEAGLGGLAARLGISDRHLRRVFGEAFGVTPVAYAQTQRLLLAKRLLADTTLPVTEVALAAGFGSLRRFNALMRARYRLAPGEMRRAGAAGVPRADDGLPPAALRLNLGYRPPLDWAGLLAFLGARCVPGVEQVRCGHFARTLALVDGAGQWHVGWVALRPADQPAALQAVVAPTLLPVLPQVLAALRRLADLGADPAVVDAALGPLAATAPGLRVPGCVDGFELAVRAVLGQQVTVKAAHTLAGRLVGALGEPLAADASPWPDLTHLFPTPERVARVPPEVLGALGIVRQRVGAIQALARAVAEWRLDLGPAADVAATVARLQALPGIGAWTAQYIALRALAWPDAWPSGDVALIKALGADSARAADARAEAWRPWRGYATLHLWRRLAEAAPPWKDLP